MLIIWLKILIVFHVCKKILFPLKRHVIVWKKSNWNGSNGSWTKFIDMQSMQSVTTIPTHFYVLYIVLLYAVIFVIFYWNTRVKCNHNNDKIQHTMPNRTEQNIGKLDFFSHQFNLFCLLFCYFKCFDNLFCFTRFPVNIFTVICFSFFSLQLKMERILWKQHSLGYREQASLQWLLINSEEFDYLLNGLIMKCKHGLQFQITLQPLATTFVFS